MTDAVLAVNVDPSGAEQGARVVRRSLEDIAASAGTGMSAVDRYNTTLNKGASAADIFSRQMQGMDAQLRAAERAMQAQAKVVSDLSLKFDVVRAAAKEAVTSLQQFGKAKIGGELAGELDRLAGQMSRTLDAGGKGAVAAARATGREMTALVQEHLRQQMEAAKASAAAKVAGAQAELERIKALHAGARTEIAAQERAAAVEALAAAKRAASEEVSAVRAANAAILAETRQHIQQVIALKQRETQVQREYESAHTKARAAEFNATTLVAQAANAQIQSSRSVTEDAVALDRIAANIRRAREERERNTAAVSAETKALNDNAAALRSTTPSPAVTAWQPNHPAVAAGAGGGAQPPGGGSGGARERERVDVTALAADLDKLIQRYDWEAAAVHRRTDALDTLRAARKAGIVDDDAEYERLRKLISGEQQHAERLVALRAEYDRTYAAEKRYADEVARVTKILDAANATEQQRVAVLAAVAQAHDPAVQKARAAADAAVAQYSAMEALKGELDSNYAAQARYAAQQQKVIDLYMVGAMEADDFAASMKRVETTFSPAAQAAKKEADALQALTDRLDPAAAAARRTAEAQAVLDEALSSQSITPERHAALTKVLQDQASAHTAAGRAATGQMRALQLLVPQMNDVFVTAASGMNPLMIMVQQGPQIIDVLMMAGKEAQAAAARFAVLAAPVLAIGAALAVAGVGAVRFASDMREMERSARLTGNAAGLTGDQFVALTDSIAAGADVSKATARDITTAYIGTGKIGGQMLADLTKAMKDYAVATGKDVGQATQELAGMFSDPAKAAADLTQRYGLLSDAQLQNIRNLQAQGQHERAQQALLEGLKPRIDGAAEKVAWYTKAWEALGKAISDTADAAGRYVAGTESDDERLARMQKERDLWRARVAADPNGTTIVDGTRVRDADKLRELDGAIGQDLWDQGERLAQAARDRTTANFNRLQAQAMDLARSVDPAINAAQNLTNAEDLLDRAVKAGAMSLQDKTRVLSLYREQLQQAAEPAKAFALEMERQARVTETAAGRARDFEQQRQQILQKRGAQPGDALTASEAADINRGLDRKYASQAADRHRTMQEAIYDAKALATATASLSQPAIIAAQAQAEFFRVLRETSDFKKAKQAEDVSYTKGMIEFGAQVTASIKTAELGVASTQRLADAQAKGGDLAMAQARAQNVYAEQVARGVDPTRALTLATLDHRKSLADLSGQQRAWNRDMAEQIESARRIAEAEGISGAAVAEANLQNKIRAQILKEGVALDSDRARAIEAGTRALEAQNAAAKVNSQIRGQNQDLTLARAEYDMLGSTNAERERAMGQLRAALDVQNDPAWQAAPEATREAWIRQAGAVAEYRSRIEDAKRAGADFASSITKGLEDILVEGGKLTDVFEELKKTFLRGALRETVTRPLNEMLSGAFSKLFAPTPLNDNLVQPVNDNDPGGWLKKFTDLTGMSGGKGALGSSRDNAMWVQLAAGGAALAAPPVSAVQTTAARMAEVMPLPGGLVNGALPVAIQDGGEVVEMIRQQAREQGVPEAVALAVAKIESGFKQYAAGGGVLTSRAGAQGVMQLMPDTASWLGVDPTVTSQNVLGGIRYLAMLGRQFGGDWNMAAAAYNAGPGRVGRWMAGDATLPSETQDYLKKFSALLGDAGRSTGTLNTTVGKATEVFAGLTEGATSFTKEQRATVDSALDFVKAMEPVTAANDNITSSIEVTSRAISSLGENAVIRAATAMEDAADGAKTMADASTTAAGGLLSSIASLGSSLTNWIGGLFSGGGGGTAAGMPDHGTGAASQAMSPASILVGPQGQAALTSKAANMATNWAANKLGGTLLDRGVRFLGLGDSWSGLMDTTLFSSGGAWTAGGWAASAPAFVTGAAGPVQAITTAGSLNAATGVSAAGNTAVANLAYGGTASGVAGGGVTVGGALGAAGAGAFGGMLGGMIGTASNSKAIGALSGAALGAGSAMLSGMMMGSAGGPVGMAIGAVVGAIMGALGTQKKATPYGGGWVDTDASGIVSKSASGGENGVDGGDLLDRAKAVNSVLATVNKAASISYDALRISTEFQGGDDGKGHRTLIGGWEGAEFSKAEQAGQIAIDFYRFLAKQMEVKEGGGYVAKSGSEAARYHFEAPDVVIKALQNMGDVTQEEGAQILQLAGNIATATTAMNEFDRSLAGVTRQAKTATEESLKSLYEERDLAKKGGIESEWKDLIAHQFRTMFDTATLELSPMETAMAQLDGQFEAFGKTIKDLGLAIADAEVAAAKAAQQDKLRKDYAAGLDTAYWDAIGEGWRTQVKAIDDEYATRTKDIDALWGSGADAALRMAEAQEIANRKVLALASSGSLTNKALDDLGRQFPALTDVIDTARVALQSAQSQIVSSVQQALTPGYRAGPTDILAQAGLGPTDPSYAAAMRWVSEAMGSFRWGDRDQMRSILIGTDGQSGLARQLQGEVGTLSPQQISAIMSAVTQSAVASLQEVEQAWQQAATAEKQAAQQLVDNWQRMGESLSQYRKSLLLSDYSPLSPLKRFEEAQAQFRDILGKAKGGDIKAAEQLQGASDAYLKANQDYWASANPAAFQEVQDGLQSVETVAERQVTLAKQQVDRLDKILGVETDLASTMAEVVKGYGKDLTDYGTGMQGLVNYALQKALPEFKGSWKNDDFKEFVNLMAPGTYGTGGFRNQVLVSLGAKADGFSGDGKGTWGDPFKAMASDDPRRIAARLYLASLGYDIKALGFASGTPAAPPGWAWVGEQGPELMRFGGGEPVIPHPAAVSMAQRWESAADQWARPANDRVPASVADFTARPRARSGGGGDDMAAVVAELREVKAELNKLRTERARDAERDRRQRGNIGEALDETLTDIAESNKTMASDGRRRVA